MRPEFDSRLPDSGGDRNLKKHLKEHIKNFFIRNPKTKKAIGIVLVALGLIALFTPLAPGSWLVPIGLEMLGFHLLLWDKFKLWLQNRNK